MPDVHPHREVRKIASLPRESLLLGTLLCAGVIETASSAVKLIFAIVDEEPPRPLKIAYTASHLLEAASMIGLLSAGGPLAGRLRDPSLLPVRVAGGLAGLGAEALAWLPIAGRWRRPADVAGAALGLASGLALRRTVAHAGRRTRSRFDLVTGASRGE